jgi:hypothetical protein
MPTPIYYSVKAHESLMVSKRKKFKKAALVYKIMGVSPPLHNRCGC